MNTEYKLTKKEKDALLQSAPIRGLAVSGVDTPEKFEITLRILNGSTFFKVKFFKKELDNQFEFYDRKYPYGLVFDDGVRSSSYWYWYNELLTPEDCELITFEELFEKYVVSKVDCSEKKVGYEEVTVFRSNLTGKLHISISDLEKSDYEYMKDDIEQHFFDEDDFGKMSINLEDLINLNKKYGVEKVQKIIIELL